MKRAIIIHCWGGTPNYAWYPWLKAELEKQGYQVTVPAMPETDHPKLINWLPALQTAIGQPDDELLLIGHSLGTATIMRYLETLADGQHIKKAILVAAFADAIDLDEIKNFFETPIDLSSIESKTIDGFVVIQSDNDPYVPARCGIQLRDELNAKLIIKHNAGHMSGPIDNETSCLELPEILENL